MKEITYCKNCKEYIKNVYLDISGLRKCPKCDSFSVVTLEEDGEDFTIEEIDTKCMFFKNKEDFKENIKIFQSMVTLSKVK